MAGDLVSSSVHGFSLFWICRVHPISGIAALPLPLPRLQPRLRRAPNMSKNSVKQLWNKSVTTTRNCETTTLFFQYYNHEFAGTPRYTDSYGPSPLLNPIQGNVWKCMELLCAHPRKTSAGTRQNLQMSSARSLHWDPGNIVQSLAPAYSKGTTNEAFQCFSYLFMINFGQPLLTQSSRQHEATWGNCGKA